MRNHTATHLLQAAMREILGAHVKQQGSSVDENRLRFDFTHHQGIKLEEIAKLENRLTQFIGFNDAVKKEVLPIEEAKKRGALAFFAEKYGDVVRVISIGDYSTEFCGGTHVNATGDIEAVKIVSEGSVAQGIRRIEAVTSRSKVNELLALRQQEEMAKQEQARQRQLDKEKAQVRFNEIKNSVGDVIVQAQEKGGLKIIVQSYADIDMASLRLVSDLFKKKAQSAAVFLGARNNDDVSVVVSLTDDLVARGLKANELVAHIAPMINGNGGGRPNLAQAGGKNVAQLDNALAKAKEIFLQQI
jgi:alanyl-tRNA synthetase